MGVTMTPMHVMRGDENPQGQVAQLAQLVIALKQAKQQETAQKKSDAMNVINTSMQLAKSGMPMDPKPVEKALKTMGLSVLDADKVGVKPDGGAPANTGSPAAGGTSPQPAAGGGAMGNVGGISLTPDMLKSLGSLPGGAQSGSQPSAKAGKQAPGGGVMSDIMSPQTVTQMSEAARAKMGIMAGIYQQGMDERTMAALKARHEIQVQDLSDRTMTAIRNNDPDAARLMGQMKFMADPKGGSMTDADVRGLLFSAGTEKEKQQVVDFVTGAESPADKAKRGSENVRSIMTSNPGIDPESARIVGKAITEGTPIPMEVQTKLSTVASMAKETEAFVKLSTNFPASAAASMAAAVGHGVPIDQAVPKGMHSIAEQSLSIEAGKLQTDRQRLQLEETTKNIELERYKQETLKLQLAQSQNNPASVAIEDFKNLALAKKAGVKIDDAVLQATVDRVAEASGMEPKEVKHWFTTSTYEWVPKASSKAMEGQQKGKGAGKVDVPDTGGSTAKEIGKMVGEVETMWLRPSTYKSIAGAVKSGVKPLSEMVEGVTEGAKEK